MSDPDEEVLVRSIGPNADTNTAGPREIDSDAMAEGRGPFSSFRPNVGSGPPAQLHNSVPANP